MEKDERQQAQKTNSDFRKTQQAREGSIATAEYLDRDAATATKTAHLRAQRLAREAAASVVSAALVDKPKGRRKAGSRKASK
jgi:hypothetical protein